ncbi:MAG: alanyl-tRNA synthetase [Myxococcota bacterium]|jgi:alanyl-tRNA synthetase
MVQSNEIRKAFLDFFAAREHAVVPSSSLIPHNDPTLFFVNAGMVQFKDVFTGADPRDYSRATTVQKCLRVSGKHNDLENVGRTPRHHTFFEMLGNFSFGDYFKSEAIPMAWSLLTDTLGVDAERLWVTVYEHDDEAYAIWRDQVGVPEARLQRLGAKDNFWSMGETGPCGPCSEIHYDHGPAVSSDTRGPAGEDDRYVEVWNLVFMQFDQSASGERTVLPRPSIDTGMGLERLAAVLQGVYSNYDTDAFRPLLRRGAELAGIRYGEHTDADTALRVIADHSRAAAFLVGDGVMPSNEGRGYVLRRVMRRAIRFGVKLEIDQPFLHETVGSVIDNFADAYPALGDRSDFVREVVLGEELRFRRTLRRGMQLLDTELSRARTETPDGPVVDGRTAFTLSDTYGFPLDLTQLIAREQGVEVDADGFDAALEEQRAMGRAAWKGSGEEAVVGLWRDLALEHGATAFTGYDSTDGTATVLALVRRSGTGDEATLEVASALSPGDEGIVLLDRTPFYAESGGQVGDTGTVGGAEVTDTTKASGLHLHHVRASVPIQVGDEVTARVDAAQRNKTRRNHTATHLMHAALRTVLGDHVSQKGSLVGPERLRFDFAHHKPMTADEIRRVEDLVNAQILSNAGLDTSVEDLEAAVERGAMALFGEKYDAEVRVVSVPGFSVELCGGTHVSRTGDIGLFRLVSEAGIAAGVRRIEAQTGTGAMEIVQRDADRLAAIAQRLKTPAEQVVESLDRLQEDKRQLERELRKLKTALAKHAADAMLDDVREVHGVKVLAAAFDGDLKAQADRLRDQLGTSVIVLVGTSGDKVKVLVAASKDIAGSRLHAGKLVKPLAAIVGGGGGGRPDMAQAGGKDPSRVPELLAQAHVLAAEMLAP